VCPLGVDLVFRSVTGTALDPSNVAHGLSAITQRAGLGHWHPHELRHSAASLLLAQGVPLKVVSDILGHSSITVTADVYAHLLAPMRDEAADAMDRALSGQATT
jgi:integrase